MMRRIKLKSNYLYLLFEVSKGSYINSLENISNYLLIKISSDSIKLDLKRNIVISKKEVDLIDIKKNQLKINYLELNIDKLSLKQCIAQMNFLDSFSSQLYVHLVPRVHQRNIISTKDLILFLNSSNYRSIIQELTITDIQILDNELLIRVEEILKILKLI